MNAAIMAQVIVEPPVTLIWTFLVDLLNRVRKAFVLCGPLAQLAGSPFVVSRARCMEQLTSQLNGIYKREELSTRSC